MIYLLGSIILTSYLTLSFKITERFRIPVFQAIVFNYLTCVVTGSVVNGSFPVGETTVHQSWAVWAGVLGCLFISLFNIVGYTTQQQGVAVASVANKLSLVIPFVFSLYLYGENATWLKITGIVIALPAVVLTCLPSKGGKASGRKELSLLMVILLPALLFVGSGLLDTLVNHVQQTYLNETNRNAFLIASFATASGIGLLVLILLVVTRKQTFDARSIPAGIAIGVPNYFSLWCLINALKQYPGKSSALIPVNNMGIVLFSSVVAWALLKEKLSPLNWLGIALSVAAIALVAFG